MRLLTPSGKRHPLRQYLVAISTQRRGSRTFESALQLLGPAELNPDLALFTLPTPKHCDSDGLSDLEGTHLPLICGPLWR
jgi:hypothetical protein